MKLDSEYTCRELPQSLLDAHRRHDGVLHRPDQTIPDQTIPDQTRPYQTIPYHTIPDQTRPD
jgi:hypothetical protein